MQYWIWKENIDKELWKVFKVIDDQFKIGCFILHSF